MTTRRPTGGDPARGTSHEGVRCADAVQAVWVLRGLGRTSLEGLLASGSRVHQREAPVASRPGRRGCPRRRHGLGTPGYLWRMRTARGRRTSGIAAFLLLAWLVIGAIAAAQRGYFASNDTSCASVTTIVVTVLAGPLNYVGVNPQVDCPELPQPSE